MSLTYLLFFVASIIVVALASYAWHLTRKVREQEKSQMESLAAAELKQREHQTKLLKDTRFLAKAVLQEQCEITEGVLRLWYTLSKLDPAILDRNELQWLRAHYKLTCKMPTHENYKNLAPRDQRRLDKERWQLEAKHKADILRELDWLTTFNFPSVTALQ